MRETQTVGVMTLVANIRHLHRVRDDLLRAELRLGNHIGAIERRLAQAREDQTICETQSASVQSYLAAPALHNARALIHPERMTVETRLKNLVKQLPVWPWIESVRGLGPLSAGQIIGCAGDLNRFANPAKLWVMMSIGIVDGQVQRRVANNPKLAIRMRFSPTRRAIMAVIGDNLIRQNQDGPYRTLYLERKPLEIEKAPDMKPIVYHRRAKRVMEKRLLRDFWTAWRAADSILEPLSRVPLAKPFDEAA